MQCTVKVKYFTRYRPHNTGVRRVGDQTSEDGMWDVFTMHESVQDA